MQIEFEMNCKCPPDSILPAPSTGVLHLLKEPGVCLNMLELRFYRSSAWARGEGGVVEVEEEKCFI
jgi:hypothetical protein